MLCPLIENNEDSIAEWDMGVRSRFPFCKALLRKAATRTKDALWDAVGEIIGLLKRKEVPPLPRVLRICNLIGNSS